MEKLAVETKAYGVVRLTEGRYWLQLDSLSGSLEVSKEKASLTNDVCGNLWANDNPISYYAEFVILENHEATK
jgi:hypothetical protein